MNNPRKILHLGLLLLLCSGLLAACGTTNGKITDEGRQVHSEDGYTTLQQSIRF